MIDNPKFNKFEEQVFLNTVFIENLTDGSTGTGFIISKPSEKEDKHKLLLFSNKHVFWGKENIENTSTIKKEFKLTFHKRSEDGKYILGDTHCFVGSITRSIEKGYYDHPDSKVDVACANISNLLERGINLNLLHLKDDNFFDSALEEGHLIAGMNIVFVGYPSGFFDYKNFLPVMRSGSIASIPSVNFNGEKRILLDAQIFPGSSGSPVFSIINGKYKLIGIVSDGVHRGLDFVDIDKTSDVSKYPIQFIGLGLLFTSDTIKEVYDIA
ncbi:serine protease [Candidatus Pacebacteria bacterium]|nr:serine protease [Candidatus Paceibacterota bacterium]